MSIIGYYIDHDLFDHRRPVYQVREYARENFSPMIPNWMWERMLAENAIQVYVDVVGGQEWINISRKDFVGAP